MAKNRFDKKEAFKRYFNREGLGFVCLFVKDMVKSKKLLRVKACYFVFLVFWSIERERRE
jgi:hypothetical protein